MPRPCAAYPRRSSFDAPLRGRRGLPQDGMHPTTKSELTPWTNLTAEQQIRLCAAYGHYLDTLPRTCDLGVKLGRFREWLAQRGVSFDGAD